jgi:hypothetical protein
MLQTNPLALPSPEWFEMKGHLFRFFGTHAGWARWQNSQSAWICGQERDRDLELARGTRIAAILHDPRLIPSRSIPEQHAYSDVTAAGWNRLLLGVFTYLNGPALLDDVVSIAGVLLHLPHSAELPTGSPFGFPESSAEHVSYEQMDAMVEGTLDASSLESMTRHVGACTFCERQVAAYQAAVERVSAPILKPKPVPA